MERILLPEVFGIHLSQDYKFLDSVERDYQHLADEIVSLSYKYHSANNSFLKKEMNAVWQQILLQFGMKTMQD